ncbi:hypothetical protein CLU96_4076 [Chryseobacterium sp. 52]|nr:hypothetical protein CLU96_4076 [Chryseobacterium sp. 52]
MFFPPDLIKRRETTFSNLIFMLKSFNFPHDDSSNTIWKIFMPCHPEQNRRMFLVLSSDSFYFWLFFRFIQMYILNLGFG